MITKLTKVADDAEDLEAGDTLLLNLDHVSAIHAEKITRKVPIVGLDNVLNGSVVTLRNGRAFPVKETADSIWESLPMDMKIGIRKPVTKK